MPPESITESHARRAYVFGEGRIRHLTRDRS